ncbi:hypothetical protein DaDZ19_05470 [Dickeya ananatis]
MLVEIENLRIAFANRTEAFEAVRGVSFSVGKEKFAIVGESGSGKSLTARSLMQLLPGSARVQADKLSFDGIDLRGASEKNATPDSRQAGRFYPARPEVFAEPGDDHRPAGGGGLARAQRRQPPCRNGCRHRPVGSGAHS